MLPAVIIGVQLLIGLVAYALGRHDVPAVDNFTFYGSTPKHQTDFHRFNWVAKGALVASLSLLASAVSWQIALWLAAANTALIWGLFDPVVAIFRTVFTPPKKPWYYLSTGNRTDRKLLQLLGPKAGIYKALICLAILLIANYLMLRS